MEAGAAAWGCAGRMLGARARWGLHAPTCARHAKPQAKERVLNMAVDERERALYQEERRAAAPAAAAADAAAARAARGAAAAAGASPEAPVTPGTSGAAAARPAAAADPDPAAAAPAAAPQLLPRELGGPGDAAAIAAARPDWSFPFRKFVELCREVVRRTRLRVGPDGRVRPLAEGEAQWPPDRQGLKLSMGMTPAEGARMLMTDMVRHARARARAARGWPGPLPCYAPAGAPRWLARSLRRAYAYQRRARSTTH